MIARSATEIAAATGGVVVQGSPSARATGASIDTRTLARGDSFFAIAGERHDGHDFIDAALARDASVMVLLPGSTKSPPKIGEEVRDLKA